MQRASGFIQTYSTGCQLLAASVAVYILGLCNSAEAKIIKFDPRGSINTEPYGIGATGWITGLYIDGNKRVHSFLRASDRTITTFDVTGDKCGTDALSINRNGTVTGGYGDRSCVFHGFIRDPGGTITIFDVRNSTATNPDSINNAGVITGDYNVCSNGCLELHGFVRAADGTIMDFDPEGSTETIPLGINKLSVIAGIYENNAEEYYGFVRAVDGTITTFDVENSIKTDANCINDKGYVVGEYYTDDTFDGYLRARGCQ